HVDLSAMEVRMNIRSVVALFAFTGLVSVAHTASAARTGVNLSIGDITVEGTGDHARIFISAGTLTGTAPAGCSANPNHFAIDLTTNKGRAQFSIAESAILAGRQIYVTGLNTGTSADCMQVGTLNLQVLDQLTII